MNLLEPLTRLKPPADPLSRYGEYMAYILKAPMLGWREAARGLGLARFIPLVEAGGVPRGGELLAIARAMEGGASPEALFMTLRERVYAELSRSIGVYVEAAGALAASSIILTVFATLPFLSIGPIGLLTAAVLSMVILMLRPGDHYYTVTPLDLVAVAIGAVVGFVNLACGFLAYGLITLPILANEWRLASGLRDRVTVAFGNS